MDVVRYTSDSPPGIYKYICDIKHEKNDTTAIENEYAEYVIPV